MKKETIKKVAIGIAAGAAIGFAGFLGIKKFGKKEENAESTAETTNE